MQLFPSDEEYERFSHDAAAVAEKADEFIRQLSYQLETVMAQADAAAITAEQTCSLLEQKFVSLSSEFAKQEAQNSALSASLEQRSSELAQVQADKHQIHIKLIAKEGEIERSVAEVSELHKSKRQISELLEQKDSDISEKNALIKTYLDKIVNKLVELYKESSLEWSKKAGELEGVIKALETHSSQIENDFKERLEMEQSARKELEKEAAQLKEKLANCEAEVEIIRKASELNPLPLSTSSLESWLDPVEGHDVARVNQIVVPNVPSGVSGTALAASLLRDGWSLVKMYTKYQEAVDALRHEQLGRKQSQAILERVIPQSETIQELRKTSEALALLQEEASELRKLCDVLKTENVREVNLLRESNVQLREENKHNFEECQKLREVTQKARTETEQLDSLLRERQTEVETCKKETQMLKMEKDVLEKKAEELLMRCQNYVDVEDYNRMRDDIKQLQENLSEKDVQLEEAKKLVYEKDMIISELEEDLAKRKIELSEREGKFNESLQVEVSLKSEIEKQKKLMTQFKKKVDMLSKEKEELRKQNEALSKQLEDYKQGRKGVDLGGEQSMKEKEREKDTRIQMLEKTLERHREELKKEKDDHKMEKAKRQKTERTIMETIKSVNQEKSKLVDGLEKHKQACQKLADEVEKLQHARNSLPEGTSVVQVLSGAILDDVSTAYVSAVENFERVANSVSSELGVPPASDFAPVVDAASRVVPSGQAATSQAPTALPVTSTKTSSPSARSVEEREKKIMLPSTNVEPRKPGRKIQLRRFKKPEAPQGDTEMPEVEKSINDEKPVSYNQETKGTPVQMTHSSVRKRLSPTSSEPHDESFVQRSVTSDLEAPVLKKSKGSDSPKETTEGESSAISEHLESVPLVQEPSDAIVADRPQGSNEESVGTDKDDAEIVGEQDEDQKMVNLSQSELQSEGNNVLEEIDPKQNETEVAFDDGLKAFTEQELQQSAVESESEREEGELLPDVGDAEEEMAENQTEAVEPHVSSPLVDEDTADPTDALNDEADLGEANEEGGDNSNDNNDQVETEPDQNPESVPDITGESKKEENQNLEAGSDLGGKGPASAVVETVGSKEGSSSSGVPETQEVKPAPQVGRTINLTERARRMSQVRRQQQQFGGASPPPARGRGRVVRGRGGRGQSSERGRG